MRRNAAYSANIRGITEEIKGIYMKKIGIRVGVLSVVFVVAVIFFSYLTNQGNTDMSAAMSSATLPRIWFTTEGYDVNPLVGYVTDMEITSMRDTVTPVNANTLTVNIKDYGETIEKVTWQVFSLDGENCLQKETQKMEEESFELHFNDNGMLDSEKVLKITLHLPTKDVYYYTRIKSSEECNYSTCLNFVKDFQKNALNKEETDTLESYLETVSGGDANGFHKVTIGSSLDYVTWGSLAPEVIDEVTWEIKECNETYTSIMLSYRVNCPGAEENAEAEYSVEEFYRVRYYNEKVYLMDYERTMEQTFEGESGALDNKGVLVGIASDSLEYQHNSDGTMVAFVQNNELWTYDQDADEFSLVFSFSEAEKEDERNYFNRHEIHIDSIDDEGNVLFYVLGYMNRGDHEGKVGVAIYLFDSTKSSVIEKAFVPSKKGYEIMREELGQFIHYSEKKSVLYVMIDGYLYRVDMEEDTKELLVRGLEEDQYVVSEDGSLLMYQVVRSQDEYSTQINFLNLATGEGFEIQTEDGEYIKPLGFINSDLVYGIMRSGDEGTLLTSEEILPMYKVEIMTQEQEIVKEYQIDGIYVQSVSIDENVLELLRVTKNDTSYNATTSDYITSNEAAKESNISLSSYSDEVRGRVQRIVFEGGISDSDAKVLKPKFVLQEKLPSIQFDEAKMQGKFYVYAFGKMQGVYENAGDAIKYANTLNGVVVSSKQAYVWERGNWPSADEIEGVASFTVAEGQSTVAACVTKILEKEGASADVSQELENGKTLVQILSEYSGGEGMDLTGCSMEELQYTISRETPIIAMIGDNNAILLTGYNKTNIAYIDPISGEKKSVTKETMESMTSPYGSVFIGYVK